MGRNRHSRNQWPDERMEQFRVLWGEPPDFLWNGVQLTCAEIGRRMGLSVSAVTGKRTRLGLPTRGSPLHAKGSGARPHQYQRVRVPAGATTLPRLASAPRAIPVVATPLPPSSPHVSRGTCQYIANDPRRGPWSFCGEPCCAPGSAWCLKHEGLVYGPKPKLRAEVD